MINTLTTGIAILGTALRWVNKRVMFSDFTEESKRERKWCGQHRLPAGRTQEGGGLLSIELRQCFIAVQIPTDLVIENCCFNAQYKICAYMKGIGKRPPANTLLLHKRGGHGLWLWEVQTCRKLAKVFSPSSFTVEELLRQPAPSWHHIPQGARICVQPWNLLVSGGSSKHQWHDLASCQLGSDFSMERDPSRLFVSYSNAKVNPYFKKLTRSDSLLISILLYDLNMFSFLSPYLLFSPSVSEYNDWIPCGAMKSLLKELT